jgi:hypothetical protein
VLSESRFRALNRAAEFTTFDKSLTSSGRSSIFWGAINLVLAAVLLSSGNRFGVVDAALGTLLVASGIYEMKVRDARVIKISALTLAFLAVWNLGGIALAFATNSRVVFGAHSIWWGIAQAYGAVNTWRSYSAYEALKREADEYLCGRIRESAEHLRSCAPKQTVDVVEFKLTAGFGENEKWVRMMPFEDAVLVGEYTSTFNRLKLLGLGCTSADVVQVEPVGEKWMSKKLKARIRLGDRVIDKAEIDPEMLSRLEALAGIQKAAASRG